MPLTASVQIDGSQLSEQFLAGLCALTRLNVDTCMSAFAGAALHWENVLHEQTPEQFVRRQADLMPRLAVQFAEYTRHWMTIASETMGPRYGPRNHDDNHESRAGTVPDSKSTYATGADAMMRGSLPLLVQTDGESVAGPQIREMTRVILARAAKVAPEPDTAERRSLPPARRSSPR